MPESPAEAQPPSQPLLPVYEGEQAVGINDQDDPRLDPLNVVLTGMGSVTVGCHRVN